MSSLFTDTIRKTGGTAGTDIEVNNSSTYVDGSNKSQNMVAAISKFWLNFSMAGTTARSDSFNNSSISDEGTGDFTLAFTNNFNYSGYCVTHCVGGHDSTDGHWDYVVGNFNQAVASSRVRGLSVNYSSNLADVKGASISWRGDLA